MVIIQLNSLKNETLTKLLAYATAAGVDVDALVEEIIEDAMLGNDIPGSLEDTLKKRESFSTWGSEVIYPTSNVPSDTVGDLRANGEPIRPAAERGYLRMDKSRFNTEGPSDDYMERFRNTKLSNNVISGARALSSGCVLPCSLTDESPLTEDQKKTAQVTKDELKKPSVHLPPTPVIGRSERARGGVSLSDALSSAMRSVDSIGAEIAQAMLLPKTTEEAYNYLQSLAPSEQNMEVWLEEAIKKIRDLPKGSVFMANQYAPNNIDGLTSRTFGRKLMQTLLKEKLFSSKKMGKSCTEYVRA